MGDRRRVVAAAGVFAAVAALGLVVLGGSGAAPRSLTESDPAARTDAAAAPGAAPTAAPTAASTAASAADPEAAPAEPAADAEEPTYGPAIVLAFAGEVHFEGALAALPDRRGSDLGDLADNLRGADVAMVNLETAVATGGEPASKELEDPGNRYWFRADPGALDVLERSGVDVASMANNHGADYGRAGLRQSLEAAADSDVAVVGIGRTYREAFTPYRTSVRGTDVAVLAADASPRESADTTWAVARGTGVGIAAARVPHAPQLLAAVRRAAATDDLVVVYLHWGEEGSACPTGAQQDLAARLAEAGADVVVGSHAHLLNGAGMLGDTYVSYGLGNFAWYHGRQSETGVLRLRVRGGEVVHDAWWPATIPAAGGTPTRVAAGARADAVDDWRALRGCTDLAPGPGVQAEPEPEAESDPEPDPGDTPTASDLPPFTVDVRRIGPALAATMRGTSHRAACPVDLADLRLVTLRHVGFDGAAHNGRLVVHADVVDDVRSVFRRLYRAGFAIRRMRLVDSYGASDRRSMAANNSSAYNCRVVEGSTSWSAHAYGRAIDLNPVQNPYLLADGTVLPPRATAYTDVDRSAGATTGTGVIGDDDVVTRAFADVGWTWGGAWSDPDYQHFAAP
ncbi:MAG: hypothetical protein CMH83_13415 [Nocardioides sp.]|nr:hypothetical protein [Nocardioides sp.]